MSKSRGQRRRPAGLDGRVRCRRAALHAGPRREPGHRRADQRGVGGRAAATSAPSSGTRPGSRCSTAPPSHGAPAARRRAVGGRPLDPVPAGGGARAGRRAATSDFQFAKISEALYHFVWDEVCDWYLELAKLPLRRRRPRRRGHPAGARRRARRRAAAAAPGRPVRHRGAVDGADRRRVARRSRRGRERRRDRRDAGRRGRGSPALQELVTEVRRFRSEQGLRPGQRVAAGSSAWRPRARRGTSRWSGRWPGWTPTGDGVRADRRSAAARGRCTVELDLSGAIDVAAERARLSKDLAAAREGARQHRHGEAGQRRLPRARRLPRWCRDAGPAGRPGRRPRSSGSPRCSRRCPQAVTRRTRPTHAAGGQDELPGPVVAGRAATRGGRRRGWTRPGPDRGRWSTCWVTRSAASR